jgi:hypothetical protein
MIQDNTQEKISDTQRIEHIRTLRNSLINDFLNDATLIDYFSRQFNNVTLNTRRIEFIKKELRDLVNAPVDLVHYAPILLEMKQQGAASIAAKYEKLFYAELEKIFNRYTF